MMNGDKFFPILAMHEYVYVGSEQDHRNFMTLVLWVLRSGSQRQTLPAGDGKWHSIFKRFVRWCQKGVGADWHQACVDQSDLQNVFIDSTLVRASAGSLAVGLALRTMRSRWLGQHLVAAANRVEPVIGLLIKNVI